ncbi:LlaJI family restriction endonuclease [Peptostreptococcaceae bacterium AGR-M142]
MKPIFLKELEKYSKQFLRNKISIEDEEFENFEKQLFQKKVMEYRNGKYSFKYVGILTFKERLIFVFPKYISVSNLNYNQKIKSIKLIIDVLRVYSGESIYEEDLQMLGNINVNNEFSYLSAINYFIEDYLEYGLYHSENKEFILNGSGEINWQKTIDEQTAFIFNKKPVYLDFYTIDTSIDDENYIRVVHKFIMNKCNYFLQKTGLIDLLEMPIIRFHIEEDSLGDINFIIRKIDNELNFEYGDRKQRLLKVMRNFLLKDSSPLSLNSVRFFGTKYFNNVWENACAYVFYHDKRLLEHITRPKWSNFKKVDDNKETLRPDILLKIQHLGINRFLILDAKYYDIEFVNGKIYKNPGIGDIIKQYMYQQALNYYIEGQGCIISNVLLFPTMGDDFELFGKVTLDFINNLEDIVLMYLPATKILTLYCKCKKLDLNLLNYFFNELDKADNDSNIVNF